MPNRKRKKIDLLIILIILYNSLIMKGITVLFEDPDILALNKPPGLPVQGGKGVAHSLDSLLSENRSPPPRLVHRLDKDTSGLIVTAKTREAAARLAALFAQGGIHKRYLAVCAGILPERGTISGSLEIKGRTLKAKTDYRRIASVGPFDGLDCPCSLAELEPATGREHQLRRHLADRGFPLLGDDKYGDFSLNRVLRKTLALRHLLLHARSLYIPPSPGREALTLEAPLPDYFLAFLEKAGMSGVTLTL
jgi:23S rRNA pseudouridine955/2504/2580 synthase